MSSPKRTITTADPWFGLRAFTEARIGLGRCGTSLPLAESLNFKLAHARARDAVHQQMQSSRLARQIEASGYHSLQLTSNISDRTEYLTRPDKGRQLSNQSRKLLDEWPHAYDLCLVLCGGLSAPAVHENSLSVLFGFLKVVEQTALTVSPVCLVENGRVAIADDIGHLLSARMSIILIGERPGLSSPNSLGVYLTYNPKPGTTDEARNCISNIRRGGMKTDEAVRKIAYLVEAGLQQKTTGVALKDRMDGDYLPFAGLISGTTND